MNIGVLAALASAFLWATTTVMMRSQSSRVDPISLNAWRSVTSAIFFVVTLLVLGRVPQLMQVPGPSLLALCGSVMFGFLLGDTLFFKAMTMVGVSTALPISMTYPLYVLVIAVTFLGETITWLTVFGTLLTIAGTVSVAVGAPSEQSRSPRDRNIGILLALCSSWCFAASTSILKLGVEDVDVIAAGVIRLSLTSLILLFARAFFVRAEPFIAYGARSLSIMSLASLVGSGLGTITYLVAVQQAGAAISSALATTAPLFATPLSVIFLRERLTRRNVLGMVLCMAGVWLVIPR
jgi:drug/metabolite transporter, DME family